MIVLDASVLASLLADDGPSGQAARQVLQDAGDASMPDLADVETFAVLRKRWLAKDLSLPRFRAAVADLADLDLHRYPTLPLLPRALELRANVTGYDAVYVALAEGLGCELVTADQRLATASGPRCTIRLLRPA